MKSCDAIPFSLGNEITYHLLTKGDMVIIYKKRLPHKGSLYSTSRMFVLLESEPKRKYLVGVEYFYRAVGVIERKLDAGRCRD